MAAAPTLRSAALWAVLCISALQGALGVEFDLKGQRKCVSEDIADKVLVVGDFALFNATYEGGEGEPPMQGVKGQVIVTGPSGEEVAAEETEGNGKFAFTTTASGEYKACFLVPDPEAQKVARAFLDWKTGVAARDWDAIARKEHLDDVTLEARKLAEIVREMHEDMAMIKIREEEMRDLSEATNTRVKWLAILSLAVCIALGVAQVLYLRRFFKRKKLL
ncbi:unnamed protein product [Pedinophyceae sp. YPF-701]|nr:unnamed protein product [Pedinophyceae sp. YPF-701]